MKPFTTTDEIHSLLHSAAALAALGTAVESGLLWLLAERPLTAAEVAGIMDLPGYRGHYWLQYLHALGILEAGPQGYTPSPLAREAILDVRSRESWQHLIIDERERSSGIHNLPLYMSHPGSIFKAQGLDEPRDYVQKMRLSPERAREFTYMLYEVHQYLADELAALLDLSGVSRLMDVGGNSGVVSMALLRIYPALTAVVVDLENVCVAGREIAAENFLSDRLTYHPAEFFKDEFPMGFDIIIKCDVSIFGTAFFQKLCASLNPGGRLVLVDHFSPSENVLPEKRLEWVFLDSLEEPSITVPTMAQVQAQLVEAGFWLLPGAHTLSDRRVVIQACKPRVGGAGENFD